MAAQSDFISKIIQGASQGAVGAVVAAVLSGVTEPVVNRVLVNRVPLLRAIQELDPAKIMDFMMKTTLPTNFIKFPFFEVTNLIMAGVDIPPALRGSATGAVFCTTTLPITNYRFRKSMDLPITPSSLYQAYLPTVFRDILYGVTRNKVSAFMVSLAPDKAGTNSRRFLNMFVTVIAACVFSAPANEFRGYTLQPPATRKSFGEFFQPNKFVRSTSVGALIMAFSLGIGTLATPQVEKMYMAIKEYCKSNPLSYVLIVLFLIHQVLESRRASQISKAVKDK